MNAARMPSRHSLLLASALSATAIVGACSDTGSSGSAAVRDDKTAARASSAGHAGGAPKGDDKAAAAATRAAETAEPAARKDAAGPNDEDADDEKSTAFCGALEIVRSDCQVCHGATLAAGAPMPLVSFEDFLRPSLSDPSRKVYELVDERIHDAQRPMPPMGALSSKRLAPLEAWLAAGAPQPAGECAASHSRPMDSSVDWPQDCEEFYTIVSHDPEDESKPYTIEGNSEVHPWTTIDAPWGDDDVQLLATRPITDNVAAVHHWILWDAKERINLTFWAPGSGGDSFPKDVGLYMPKGEASLGLDMHYYNRNNDQPVHDRSGVELCIARKHKRPKTAALYGLFGNATVAAMQRVVNSTSCVVTGELHLLGVNPHMHRMGRHAHLELQHGDDPVNVLYDGPFAFEEQTLKPLKDTLVREGDVLTTVCTFENTSNRNITFGEGTDDEMCINWIRYYPKGGFSCSRMAPDGSPIADPELSPHAEGLGDGDDDADAGAAPLPAD